MMKNEIYYTKTALWKKKLINKKSEQTKYAKNKKLLNETEDTITTCKYTKLLQFAKFVPQTNQQVNEEVSLSVN